MDYQDGLRRFAEVLADPDHLPQGIDIADGLCAVMATRVPRSAFEVAVRDCRRVGPQSGIYFLFDSENITYIGRSGRIGERIRTHTHEAPRSNQLGPPPKSFNSVGVVPLSEEHTVLAERRMLRAMQPSHNQKGAIDRKGWAWVHLDDLAEALQVEPGLIRQLCSDNDLPTQGESLVEIRDVLKCWRSAER